MFLLFLKKIFIKKLFGIFISRNNNCVISIEKKGTMGTFFLNINQIYRGYKMQNKIYQEYRRSREFAKTEDGRVVSAMVAEQMEGNPKFCCECGESLVLASKGKTGKRTHFKGKCRCKVGRRPVGERRQGRRTAIAVKRPHGAVLETIKKGSYKNGNFKTERYEVTQKCGEEQEGWYMLLTLSGEKVALVQEENDLDYRQLGVDLVNIMTTKGYKYTWSREEQEAKELEKYFEKGL